jgi:hypothetical protein
MNPDKLALRKLMKLKSKWEVYHDAAGFPYDVIRFENQMNKLFFDGLQEINLTGHF